MSHAGHCFRCWTGWRDVLSCCAPTNRLGEGLAHAEDEHRDQGWLKISFSFGRSIPFSQYFSQI